MIFSPSFSFALELVSLILAAIFELLDHIDRLELIKFERGNLFLVSFKYSWRVDFEFTLLDLYVSSSGCWFGRFCGNLDSLNKSRRSRLIRSER